MTGLATEPAEIVDGLTVGVGLVPEAGYQVDELAVGEAGQHAAEVDE